jgi:lipoate-protein ligase A
MKYIEFDNQLRASYSFALEEYIMTQPKFTDEYFIFWRTLPTLMIGRFQNTIEEINTEFVEKNKINIIRRNSGGGTIYTDENGWQFSFITWKEKGKVKDFRSFTKPIIDAIKELGINTNFSGRNDLMLGDKKFSGNAQFTIGDRFLHHGAILFDTNIDNMIKALLVGDEKIISKGIKSVRERVTNIKQSLNNPDITSEEFKSQMISIIGKKMEVIGISDDDLIEIKKIESEKFLDWNWNYGKSPEFNITKTTQTKGGKFVINLNVKNGIIKNCKLNGDFFFTGDIIDFENNLIGCRYEKYAIRDKILENNFVDSFLMISTIDLIDCFI